MKTSHSARLSALLVGLAVASAPATALAARHIVNAGESIQAAVDAAAAGDTVIVMPGDYMDDHGGTAAVRITKTLRLLAKNKEGAVRIMPAGGQTDGILVEPENPGDPDVERVTIQGFTVEGFSRNGIWTRHVNRFKIIGNETSNTDHVGIFPTLSANGVVKKNLAYGTLDASLWVEASENVRVIKNEFHSSPTGLEVTVSRKVIARRNDVHDNTVGVGLYHPNGASLPPLAGHNGDWKFIRNEIYNNNMANPVTGGLVGALPQGIGVLLLGVSDILMKSNVIIDNDLIGQSVLDYCLILGLVGPAELHCDNNPPIAPSPASDVRVINNMITGNGGNPPGGFEGFAVDFLMLPGAGTGNCESRNTYDTFLGGLPAC